MATLTKADEALSYYRVEWIHHLCDHGIPMQKAQTIVELADLNGLFDAVKATFAGAPVPNGDA